MIACASKLESELSARALKRAAAAMPRWSGASEAGVPADPYCGRPAGVLPESTGGRDAGVTGTGGRDARGTHPKWRRLTGITAALEPFMDKRERRAGLKRLVKWLKKKNRVGPASPPALHAGGTPALHAGGTPVVRKKLSAVGDWDISLGDWAAVREMNSIEALCRELGVSHGGLTRLTREYCGLSAQELIDGFNIGRLKHALIEKCREAARALWSMPGEYAKMRCLEQPRSLLTNNGDYFAHQQKLFEETEEDAIARRMTEILGLLRTLDLNVLAVQCGFGSAARLKRACLNVLGKSFKQVLATLAREVLEYYLAAEQKALRDLASREPANAIIMRARTLYWDREEAPEVPFLDRWSAAEFGAAEWLRGMQEAFG